MGCRGVVGSGSVTYTCGSLIHYRPEPCIHMCGYDDWLAVGVAVRNVLVIESIVNAYTRVSMVRNCCVSLRMSVYSPLQFQLQLYNRSCVIVLEQLTLTWEGGIRT